MPQFVYKARDKQGQEKEATQEAASEEQVITRLQNEGLFVISISQQEIVGKKLVLRRRTHTKVSIDDLVVFTRQLATLLEAGVTLLKSLEVLSKQIESKTLLKTVKEIKEEIAGGSTFRDALVKHPEIFSEFWVHMVETGEASGALPLAFTQLGDYLESTAAMRRKVVSAMAYPAVLVLISIVAMTFFVVWIIPVFSRVFATFGTELPVLTTLVVGVSVFARKYFLTLVAMFGVLVYLFNKYIHTERGKWQFDRFLLKIPVLSSLFQRIAIERFASGLATLIESGVPILYGLDIIGKATGNSVVEKAIVDVRESVRQGKGMAKPLEESGVFTPMVVQMVSVGEEIGELSKMLKKVSEFYKERIAATLMRIGTLIEPAVLVFMGAVIGIVVVAMFMPIFQLAVVSPAR
ncbi:MAG: type II secretion system F family protein [Candidatus Omnitrophica bacterium]|nr:type II secretion system F family protein [Candidatus Omnitrophota bacterium]